jgi:adenosine kinase
MSVLRCKQDSSIGQIASAIANLPKANASRPRLVLITQGANATLVASSSPSSPESAAIKANLTNSDPNPKTFPVPKLSDDQIVDTNGAGDMFAGGFLGALALGKTLDVCVETGHKLGQMCVSQVGPTLKYPKENVLSQ